MKSRRLISILFVLLFLAPARVYADEGNIPKIQQPPGEKDPGNVLTVVKKDIPAPFTGILLSPGAVAEMLAKMEMAKKEAELAASRAREEQRIRDESEIKGLQVELNAEKKASTERIMNRDDRIFDLRMSIAKLESDRPNPVTWTLIGAGSAAVIIATIATVILVGK